VQLRYTLIAVTLLIIGSSLFFEESKAKREETRPEDLPTSSLISQPGPSFRVPQAEAGKHTRIIVYGDQRFTDPANTTVTDPKVRRLLVQKIAEEHPDAILMNGDVPYSGDKESDYAVYKTETQVWRTEHLHVYPALGNHEFHGDPQQALEHWWNAFPELRNRRWYSAELGEAIYTIALDSDTSLAKGSDQWNWLNGQLTNLPETTRFVFISLHHPPVADFQTRINVSHNPRPNEIALRDYLEGVAPQIKARIIVCAGHIHNYERFLQKDVTFLVSGGGAAKPVEVERAPDDLYQDKGFPNYHFVEFVLNGDALDAKMYRLADAGAQSPTWEVKDTFTIHAK
jgi:acid phosphatase type 7